MHRADGPARLDRPPPAANPTRRCLPLPTCAALPAPQGGLFADASALAVVAGSVTEAIAYTKTASLHLWLLGYEFTGVAASLVGRAATF